MRIKNIANAVFFARLHIIYIKIMRKAWLSLWKLMKY